MFSHINNLSQNSMSYRNKHAGHTTTLRVVENNTFGMNKSTCKYKHTGMCHILSKVCSFKHQTATLPLSFLFAAFSYFFRNSAMVGKIGSISTLKVHPRRSAIFTMNLNTKFACLEYRRCLILSFLATKA